VLTCQPAAAAWAAGDAATTHHRRRAVTYATAKPAGRFPAGWCAVRAAERAALPDYAVIRYLIAATPGASTRFEERRPHERGSTVA
jgi:hypothetical protein